MLSEKWANFKKLSQNILTQSFLLHWVLQCMHAYSVNELATFIKYTRTRIFYPTQLHEYDMISSNEEMWM